MAAKHDIVAPAAGMEALFVARYSPAPSSVVVDPSSIEGFLGLLHRWMFCAPQPMPLRTFSSSSSSPAATSTTDLRPPGQDELQIEEARCSAPLQPAPPTSPISPPCFSSSSSLVTVPPEAPSEVSPGSTASDLACAAAGAGPSAPPAAAAEAHASGPTADPGNGPDAVVAASSTPPTMAVSEDGNLSPTPSAATPHELAENLTGAVTPQAEKAGQAPAREQEAQQEPGPDLNELRRCRPCHPFACLLQCRRHFRLCPTPALGFMARFFISSLIGFST